MPLIDRIQRFIHGLKGFERRKPQRYLWLRRLVRENRCRRIMEVGVLHGEHAEEMIREAQKSSPSVSIEYYGFDLFEPMDTQRLSYEASKQPSSLDAVQARLEATGAGVHLFPGDTRISLPRAIADLPMMDLIVIDGGHSLETIASDWSHCSRLMHEKTIVLFDDYYNWTHVGARQTIDALSRDRFEVSILPPTDRFAKGWKILDINYALVKRLCKP